MDKLIFENGRFRGLCDSEGRIFNENMELIAVRQSDGSYYDYRTGNAWREEDH